MLMTKFVGKPYAGKLHVRFDEGAGKVFCLPRSTLLVIFTTERHKEGHKVHRGQVITHLLRRINFIVTAAM